MLRAARRILLSALLAAAAAPLVAQTVRGTLVDPATGGGIRGASVVLLEPGGHEASSAVTGPTGEFMLHAGHGGRFSMRADRIGYRATATPPFDLAVGQTVERRLTASAERVGLEAIAVTSRARCRVRPGDGSTAGTAVVWEEARKALQVAQATSRARVYRFALRRFRRELDPRTEAVRREDAQPVSGWSGDPFVAASPRVLADSGWMRQEGDTLVYFAPDAAALLSGEFQDSHCFRLVDAPSDHPGWIGVAFEPVRRGDNPDVKGTVWVDRQTAELQAVDYHYTNLPGGRRAEEAARGTIAFRRLPAGNWIVSAWRIRMPQVAQSRFQSGSGLQPEAAVRTELNRLTEEGGEVTSVALASGQAVSLTAGAGLVGVVFDSTRSAPLAGAAVSLVGTSYRAVTDSAGRFDLRDLPDGTYQATFASPRLDSLGFRPAPVPVTLGQGRTTRADLSVPPLSRVLAAACADSAGAAGGAPLVGVVRTDGEASPTQGIAVTAWWTPAGDTAAVRRVALADYRGVYRFCSVPAGVPVHLGAVGAGSGPAVVEVTLAAGVPAQQDLTVPRRARPVGASLVGMGNDVATVWGRVVAAGSGTPVAGATVRLGPSLPPATTDRSGHFRIDRVQSGTYDVVVTAPLFGEQRTRAEVPYGGLDLELRLPARTGSVALAPVVVNARQLTPVEVLRRQSGTRVELFSRQDLANGVGAPNVQNVLRGRQPALKVVEVYYPQTAMVESVHIYYHQAEVSVYLDDVLLDPKDFAYLSPDRIEQMEFFPQGYRSYGAGAMTPVLLIHSRK